METVEQGRTFPLSMLTESHLRWRTCPPAWTCYQLYLYQNQTCEDHRIHLFMFCCFLPKQLLKGSNGLFQTRQNIVVQVTVVGAGPCGLRTAIEAQLLGARVTVIEKRTSFTRHCLSCGHWAIHAYSSFFFRNNVLHLWPWVIEDLKSLGAKNFYPRFCTGTMNHISIRCLLQISNLFINFYL